MCREEYYHFTNDFVFCTVLRRDKELCRRFIEIILGIRVSDIEYVESQDTIDLSIDSKGIRLDVYVDDGHGTVIDLEMQTTVDSGLARRSRYYQSMIDMSILEKGRHYSELKKSYIVFICMKDPFKAGRAVYSFIRTCREDHSLELNDGTETVFINAAGRRDGLDRELESLLDYLRTDEPASEFTTDIEAVVNEINKDSEWRKEYMTLSMKFLDKYYEGKAEGIAEGKAEGITKGFQEAVASLLNKGIITREEAAAELKIPVQQLDDVLGISRV